MAVMLKGKSALLLAEGCKLKKIIKEKEKRLDEIKEELNITKADTYINEVGDQLIIAETEKFSDVNPSEVLAYLKKKNMTNRFPDLIKVQITSLRKIVPDSMIDKWRVRLDSVYRWSWK